MEPTRSVAWCNPCKLYREVVPIDGVAECRFCGSRDMQEFSPHEPQPPFPAKLQQLDTRAGDDKLSREAIAQVLAEPVLDGVAILYFDRNNQANLTTGGLTNAEKAYLLYFMQMNLHKAMGES